MHLEIVSATRPRTTETPAADLAAHEVVDLFVRRHGPAAGPSLPEGPSTAVRARNLDRAAVVRDLALALADLTARPQGKVAVRFCSQPWEMCIERFGATASVSVYRTGPEPHVVVHDHPFSLDEVVAAARDAVDREIADLAMGSAERMDLARVADLLQALGPTRDCEGRVPDLMPVVIEPNRDAPVAFGAELLLRDGRAHASEASHPGGVEHTDLHALLFRGRLRAEIRGRAVDLGDCHPLLVAERLVELARRAFDAWERGLPLHARGEVAGVLVGVRVSGDGAVSLTLGTSHHHRDHIPAWPEPTPDGAKAARNRPREARYERSEAVKSTFPALGVADLLEAALVFGRQIVRAILRRDRTQSANLRLSAFRRSLREATEALRDASQTDCKINPTPEHYRAYATAAGTSRPNPVSSQPAARLRYATRWRAIVPGIDLRGTYLCGDRLVVCAATEMWALDRVSGRVLWRAEIERGTSVVAPGGIGRLAHDGSFCVHDLASGSVTVRTRIAPRLGGPAAGAVVYLPGLPKLAVVTEGEHHLVAIDLTTGEPRWRWSWATARARSGSARGTPRMKRAGKLLYFTSGDGALTALDAMTGAIVWRVRDRLRFRMPPVVAHDALFVVAGGAHGAARLYRIDPYSGHIRWSALLGEGHAAGLTQATPCTVEGPPLVSHSAVAVAVRTARHAGSVFLAAFGREDGAPIPRTTATAALAPSGTSWLAVDDAFVGNAPTGDLVSTDAHGNLRWRHVRADRPPESDVPRRLEPVLRGGALFVPHTDVAVLRPNDGAVLGTIDGVKAGLIPDLLRVDERGDVYVAEESGHLVAFGALPRLRLV
jgi:outer membrane protein assembly factor BamB